MRTNEAFDSVAPAEYLCLTSAATSAFTPFDSNAATASTVVPRLVCRTIFSSGRCNACAEVPDTTAWTLPLLPRALLRIVSAAVLLPGISAGVLASWHQEGASLFHLAAGVSRKDV